MPNEQLVLVYLKDTHPFKAKILEYERLQIQEDSSGRFKKGEVIRINTSNPNFLYMKELNVPDSREKTWGIDPLTLGPAR